jgi:hypothetical protein
MYRHLETVDDYCGIATTTQVQVGGSDAAEGVVHIP